jgi:hypothetical protein
MIFMECASQNLISFFLPASLHKRANSSDPVFHCSLLTFQGAVPVEERRQRANFEFVRETALALTSLRFNNNALSGTLIKKNVRRIIALRQSSGKEPRLTMTRGLKLVGRGDK